MPNPIITGYAEMWPREVFDIKGRDKLVPSIREKLKASGVYILYRDDHPYYIGKTTGKLYDRIWAHANLPKDRYYNFWNFFSTFVVPKKSHIEEVESILIASTPTQNRATPRIKKLKLAKLAKLLKKRRLIQIER